MLSGKLTNGHQTIGFRAFGDTRQLQEEIKKHTHDCFLYGRASFFNNAVWLNDVELIDSRWVGRMRPSYQGKPRVIGPYQVRNQVMRLLREAIPAAAHWILSELALPEEDLLQVADAPKGWSLHEILQYTHLPRTPEDGERAILCLERIAAAGVVRKGLIKAQREVLSPKPFKRWESLAARMPFQLTDEQQAAVSGTIEDFSTGRHRHVLLSGDVGTGKTAVFSLVVAAAVAAGQKATILLPSTTLAEQIFSDIKGWWPGIPAELVIGENGTRENLDSCPLLVGTSALLFRQIGQRDLVVVDEQQKFSRAQREHLLSSGSRMIESTATCIPRTQALVRYGAIRSYRLMHCHVEKHIHTRIWEGSDRREMLAAIRKTVDEGWQALIVYPKREARNETDHERDSVEKAFELWNRLYPGEVKIAHGGKDDEVNLAALNDMKEGRGRILISTSLVEVGITIPRLRRVSIISAERFGLSPLHQLRGRAARTGGEGWCDLYSAHPLKEEARARLQAMVDHCNGFDLAAIDMKLRGFGDLGASSGKQSGADDGFLFGRPLRVDVLDAVLNQMEKGKFSESRLSGGVEHGGG